MPNFYASNTADGPEFNLGPILWGWIRGFPTSRGWNGCLSLPRVLSLSEDGIPAQRPLPELYKLRKDQVIIGYHMIVRREC